jgi:uncharacterized membrane protein YtjA (UPF0391 family)
VEEKERDARMQEAQVCRAIFSAHPLHPRASFVFSFIESNAALTTAGAAKVEFKITATFFLTFFLFGKGTGP